MNTTLPTTLRAGDTYKWTQSFSGYPASSGWAVVLYIRGAIALDITGVANVDSFDFTITAAQSITLTPGRYTYQIRATLSGDVYTVEEGGLDITVNLALQGDGYDARTHAEIMVDSIKRISQGRATKEDMARTIGGKSLQFLSPRDLLNWLHQYEREVRIEKRRARQAAGKPAGGMIVAQMDSV